MACAETQINVLTAQKEILGALLAVRQVRRKLELEGDSLTRPPKGFDPNHPFIEDLKRKEFVASVALSEEQVCGPRFMREFVAACKTMLPLVEFTTRVLGLKF